MGRRSYHTATQRDSDGRPTTTTLSRVSDGATLLSESLTYDPVGNVSAVSTTLPQGTDQQAFCYDEQNRLTWAGTTSGNPCNNPAPVGSFGAASYTQSFTYDALNRLTSGPLGSYTYGDGAHLHAATSVSSGYTATYDAAGDMTCRAPSSSTTCAGGSPTGQQLTWDVEGRLATWQNTPTSPTTTASYLYDGEGQRVVQQVTDTTAGTTTTTSYIGSLETVTRTGATTTTTDYIPTGSVLAEAVNGTLSYLATNHEGSVEEALDGSGTGIVTASQLYAPYGNVRYSSGALPTDYGYTGQRSDATTGLDYYGARSYDPLLGQFTSADTLLAGGLNRYGYVGGNPTSATDPSGHMLWTEKDFGGGGAVGWGVYSVVGGMISAGIYTAMTTQPLGADYPTVPDEMDRANARAGVYLGFDDWSQVRANRYKASHPSKTTSPSETPSGGGGGGGGGGVQPQEQSGSGEDTAAPEPEPQPSAAGRGARRCTPEEMKLYPEACGMFEFLYGVRGDLGMAPNAGALVYLEVGDIATYGYPAHALHNQVYQALKPNLGTATHAEGLAFYRAYLQGVRSGAGTLYVDRSLCDYCGKRGGVRTMVRNLGLSRLTVYELLEGGGIRISEILP